MTSIPNHFYVSIDNAGGTVTVTVISKSYVATSSLDAAESEDFVGDFGDTVSACVQHIVGMVNEPAPAGEMLN